MSSVEFHPIATANSQCSACETPLPLCEALDSEEVRIWVCSHCEAEFSGVLAPNYSVHELRAVRPAPVIFNPESIQPINPEMQAFAQQLDGRDNNNIEKRSSGRHSLVAVLTAIEFDEQLRPVGSPFRPICRNLSAGGACLINDRAVLNEFLALELLRAGGVPIQTLVHVRRRRPLGPYHDIGVEFVTKFASSTSKLLR